MFYDVGHRLLANAKQIFLYYLRQRFGIAGGLHLEFNSCSLSHLPAASAQCLRQIKLLQRAAAQIPHGAPELNLALPEHIARQLKMTICSLGISFEKLCGSVKLEADPRQRLL